MLGRGRSQHRGARPEVYEDTIPPPPGGRVSDWMVFHKPLKGTRPDGDMSVMQMARAALETMPAHYATMNFASEEFRDAMNGLLADLVLETVLKGGKRARDISYIADSFLWNMVDSTEIRLTSKFVLTWERS